MKAPQLYQIVNFQFKVDENYSAPALTLSKKNGETISKTLNYDEQTGWYSFSVTIGAVNSGDDIQVWFGDDTYYVGMKLVAQENLTRPAEYYLHEEGSAKYFFAGEGQVDFGKPEEGREIAINAGNEDALTAPQTAFPTITVDGQDYTYSADGAMVNTYTFKGWEVAKAVHAGQNASEWHVDGVIELHRAPIELPEAIRPAELQDVTATYDGAAHSLTIDYKENYPEASFKVEYQVGDGNWTDQAPSQTDVGRQDVKVRFTYQKPAADKNEYLPWVTEASIAVTPRPLVLTVDAASKTEGEKDPNFAVSAAGNGQTDSGLLPGHTLEELKFNRESGEEAGSYEIALSDFVIRDGANAVEVSGNYAVRLEKGVLTILAAPVDPTPIDPTPTEPPTTDPTPTEPPTTDPAPTEPAPAPAEPVAPAPPTDNGGTTGTETGAEPAAQLPEEITEEETPLAAPGQAAGEDESVTETIEDEATAKVGVPQTAGGWALLNLILMVLAVLAGLAMLGLRFARKTGTLHLMGVVPALASLAAFLLTQDMSLPMVMIDKWTLAMALIVLVQMVLFQRGLNAQAEEQTEQ